MDHQYQDAYGNSKSSREVFGAWLKNNPNFKGPRVETLPKAYQSAQ